MSMDAWRIWSAWRLESIMATEAQKRAVAKYDANNTIQVKLKLNVHTDADIIKHLERQDNKQGYIKRLIRRDLRRK